MDTQPDTDTAPRSIILPPRPLAALVRAVAAEAPSSPRAPLAERLAEWGRSGVSTALLVLSALVGAWWGYRRERGSVVALVYLDADRSGLDWRGLAEVNSHAAQDIAEADPPESVAVATVGKLLERAAAEDRTQPGRIQPVILACDSADEHEEPWRVAVDLAALASALAALADPSERVALYPWAAHEEDVLIVLGAGWTVAVPASAPPRAPASPTLVTLAREPLASLVLGRVA